MNGSTIRKTPWQSPIARGVFGEVARCEGLEGEVAAAASGGFSAPGGGDRPRQRARPR